MNIKFDKWSRPNPASIKKVEYAIFMKIFDGDHAPLNRYAVRGKYTVEQAMEKAQEYEEFYKKEKKLKEDIEKFKEKASKGEISINLKDVSDKLFYESDTMNEFWRVMFLLHNKQKEESVKVFNDEEIHFLIEREPEFIHHLEEREKIVWDSFRRNNQNINAVANEIGISVMYVSRLLKRIFYSAKKGS